MVKLNIYKGNDLVDSLEIPVRFQILEDLDGDVFWRIPDEPREAIRKRLQGHKPRGGSLLLWCGGSEDQKYIALIPHNWRLWINGIECPQGTYRNFPLKWARVELIYKSYHFEFLSPQFEDNQVMELPSPSRPYKGEVE